MRNPSFALRSPQSGCSPAGSEGTPKRMYYLASPLNLLQKTRFMHCDGLIMNGFFFFLLKFFVAALSIVWSLLLLLLLTSLFLHLVLLLHSGLSSPADSAVAASLHTLTEGRTRPETAATATEENPLCQRGERYVRHRELKQGLHKSHPEAV